MCAAGHPGEDASLFDTVKAVGMELCPALGVSIPVGKDSMSMKTTWKDAATGEAKAVTAPLSLIVSAFAPVVDARRTLTPQLRMDLGETELVLVDLGGGRNRLGGSALAQVHGQVGNVAPDVDDPAKLAAFFGAIQSLNAAGRILAYHDRSDGGLFATLCEMAFAGRAGVTVVLDNLALDPKQLDVDGHERQTDVLAGNLADRILAVLFNEELGAVLQIRKPDRAAVMQALRDAGLSRESHVIGHPNADGQVRVIVNGKPVLAEKRADLHRAWSSVTHAIQRLRDNPACADQEYDRILDESDPGLNAKLTFAPDEDIAAPFIAKGARPRIAILREQGVNGQMEMAAAFDRAGFAAVDVHMSDIISGRTKLSDFKGFAACGGFSYGDTLGAGEGWAKSVLFNARARDEFEAFFNRADSFALGRLQRLPDGVEPQVHHPGRAELAALREEPLRAVRGALHAGGGAEVALDPLRGHGRQPHPHRHGARRGESHVQGREDARGLPVPGGRALRGQPRQAHGGLSVQRQRLARRHHRGHDARRALHDHDAAPRARLPHRPHVLAPGRLGRGFALDAHVPQRSRLARLASAVSDTVSDTE